MPLIEGYSQAVQAGSAILQSLMSASLKSAGRVITGVSIASGMIFDPLS